MCVKQNDMSENLLPAAACQDDLLSNGLDDTDTSATTATTAADDDALWRFDDTALSIID